MGRFINADAFASTGQGILGNNMFAYCGNNPVIRFDPSGTISYICFGDEFLLSDQMFNVDGGGGTVGIPSSRSASAKVIENEARYINNTSAEVVLESETIAFYNGVPVIRVKTGNTNSFSFGAIFLGDAADIDDIDLLRHEYGHTVQLQQLGSAGYFLCVVVPSVYYFYQTEQGIYSWNVYFDRPWEYTADVFGQVNRTHSPNAPSIAEIYWDFSKTISQFVG